MAIELTWLGHGTWLIDTGKHKILLDPFLDESPTAPYKSDQIAVDFILVSHGHGDHVSDAPAIAHQCDATVITNYEISQWLADNHQVEKVIGMNLGGSIALPFGRVKMTLALHSSRLPDGAEGGNPCGFLVSIGEKKIYFACDTGLFLDMKLIGSVGVDLAVLPIGDLFTMGPDDALEAVKLIAPKQVAPDHFGTWPPIEQDAQAWAERVRAETSSEPVVLKPGEKIKI